MEETKTSETKEAPKVNPPPANDVDLDANEARIRQIAERVKKMLDEQKLKQTK